MLNDDHPEDAHVEDPPAAADPSDDDPAATALITVLVELDRHIAGEGWDQPARLFALVGTQELLAAEPALAESLPAAQTPLLDAHDLTAVEQHTFVATDDLLGDLEQISWPAAVRGCALSTVRSFLPAGREDDLAADDPSAVADIVAAHPDRQDVRVVVGVDRAGHGHGVARLASRPDELLGGPDLVPGLLSALAHTLN